MTSTFQIMSSLSDRRDAIKAQIEPADLEAERLARIARAFEDSKEDTPENFEELNRLIDVARDAERVHETLIQRVELLQKAILAIEEEGELENPRPRGLSLAESLRANPL